MAEDGPRGYWLEADNQNREYRPENRLYVNASCRRSARCLDVLSFLPFGIMRSYPGFCRSKQLEYNPGLTHRRRAGHPRANRRTSDRPSFCGVRPSCSRVIMSCHIFQSTHPLRGATRQRHLHGAQVYISIHAPLAGCDVGTARVRHERAISIHAPLAACDGAFRQRLPARTDFNPRTPCRVRRRDHHRRRQGVRISIHAPLAGCDCWKSFQSLRMFRNFNPRTPCGVRPSLLAG